VNAIKVSPLLLSLSGVLGALAPRMKVPMASFTHQLTHDAAITQRHLNDERDGIRASEITVRFGNALTHAQQGLAARLPGWKHPLFAVLAGEDRLADSNAAELMLRTIRPRLLTLQRHAQNYHENFNELNREQIFADILAWMEPRFQG
jgi:esterase/lipase